LNAKLNIVGELYASFDAMGYKRESREGQSDATDYKESFDLSVNLQGRQVEEGNLVVNKVEIPQEGLSQSPTRKCGRRIKLEETGDE
jgi:hypothetical protein